MQTVADTTTLLRTLWWPMTLVGAAIAAAGITIFFAVAWAVRNRRRFIYRDRP